MKNLLQFVLLLMIFQVSFAQVNTEVKQFFSQALNQNRTVYVYRPDTLAYPGPLPVMIFLPGWTQPPSAFPQLGSKLASLLNTGLIDPMLIVVPDGSGGIYTRSMYWNSPDVNGYYGDYIAIETVDFVKQNYDVIEGPGQTHLREAFIIGGFSMGGGGAARVGYKWGDVFSGIAAFSGDIDHRRIFDPYVINTINNQARRDSLNNIIYTPPDPSRAFEYAYWGYASALSPDTNAQYLCQFALREGDGTVIDSVKNEWLEAGPVHTAEIYYQNYDQSSMALFFAVALNDPWYAGTMTQSFVDWINQNYTQVPLTYHIHNSGHSMPSALVDSMLIWADAHFQNIITGVKDNISSFASDFSLSQNYPNPFNPTTRVQYSVADKQQVLLKVFDLLGKEIATLVNEEKPAGEYTVEFNASKLSSGIYFYQLQAGDFAQTKKMILMR